MKVFFAKLSVLTSMLLLYGATSVWAQGKGKISFSGTVQASETEGGGGGIYRGVGGGGGLVFFFFFFKK